MLGSNDRIEAILYSWGVPLAKMDAFAVHLLAVRRSCLKTGEDGGWRQKR